MKRSFILPLLLLSILPSTSQSSIFSFGRDLLEQIQPIESNSQLGAGLSSGQIVGGLKDALRIGAKKAVATVGKPGGFLNNKAIRIPLPGPLAKVKSGLSLIGASGIADDLERRMNKAAEIAAPKAANIFARAIGRMSISDARSILTGPSDSATKYFRRSTSSDLMKAMKPIIDKSLARAGVVRSYKRLTSSIKRLPLGSKINLDMSDYVTNKTLDGIFHYLAKEEADIRANPAARTTKALRTVFR